MRDVAEGPFRPTAKSLGKWRGISPTGKVGLHYCIVALRDLLGLLVLLSQGALKYCGVNRGHGSTWSATASGFRSYREFITSDSPIKAEVSPPEIAVHPTCCLSTATLKSNRYTIWGERKTKEDILLQSLVSKVTFARFYLFSRLAVWPLNQGFE